MFRAKEKDVTQQLARTAGDSDGGTFTGSWFFSRRTRGTAHNRAVCSAVSIGGPVGQTLQLAEKLKFLSFRGALRAEESLFLWLSITERLLASLGKIKYNTLSASCLVCAFSFKRAKPEYRKAEEPM